MDITSPAYMIGSWVFWGSIVLPTMYINSIEDSKGKKDPEWLRLTVLFGQIVVSGGLMLLSPSVRPFILNPIPLITMALIFYLLKYSKGYNISPKELVQWVSAGSLILTVAIPSALYGVARGDFTGGKYSGLKPGTIGYTAGSFVFWAIVLTFILQGNEKLSNTSTTSAPPTTPTTSAPPTTPTTPTTSTTSTEPANKPATKTDEIKNFVSSADSSIKKGLTDLGLGSIIPALIKSFILVVIASVPLARDSLSSPIAPIFSIVAFIILKFLNIATTVEILAMFLVGFLPQIRTLILNPLPPVMILGTYLGLNRVGVTQNIAPIAAIASFALTMLFQVLQNFLPTILSNTGLTLETGTFFYNNFSILAWYLLILPSSYFFLRSRGNIKPSVPMSKEVRDIIQLAQALLIYILAAGIQSFKGLYLNPVPPLSFIIILIFSLLVKFFNPKAKDIDPELLTVLMTVFGYGSSIILSDKAIETIYSGGFPESPAPPNVTPPPTGENLMVGEPNLGFNVGSPPSNSQPQP